MLTLSPPSRGRADQSCQKPRTPGSSTGAKGSLVIQEAPQLPRPARMLEFAQRLRLDLADALARDAELLSDLLERALVAVFEAKP